MYSSLILKYKTNLFNFTLYFMYLIIIIQLFILFLKISNTIYLSLKKNLNISQINLIFPINLLSVHFSIILFHAIYKYRHFSILLEY